MSVESELSKRLTTRTKPRQRGPRAATAENGSNAAGTPHLEIKLQVNLPGGSRLGPGKIRLLELIDSEGSLSRGAEKMGISYRRAWLFVQQINQTFDAPSIATPEGGHGGGPARLTPFGRELVERYRDLERAATRASADTLSWLERRSG